MNVIINDCTIRDGGYLFNKNSDPDFVTGVIEGLLSAGIDIIETGFLQNNSNGESLVYKNSADARRFLPDNAGSDRFTGFCDNSRYCADNLDEYTGKSFDYLRISFAKHEAQEALEFAKKAKEKNYKVFINPMDAPSYTDKEREKIILDVNEINPYAFSIVDTFGVMYLKDLCNIFKQVDYQLNKTVKIGLHSHNNLRLSNALAEIMIDLAAEADRDIVIDGSLYGMGRGAGNASTEVLAEYLNKKYNKNYDIGILLDTIEKYIIPSADFVTWGYDLPMFICGAECSHVDNIFYLKKQGIANASDILEIISHLKQSARKRYGINYSKTDFPELENECRQFAQRRL